MTQSFPTGAAAPKPTTPIIVLLSAKEASKLLKLSVSWLAKARMRGDGPPYMQLGRAVRYSEGALLQWMKSRTRMSTSEQ